MYIKIMKKINKCNTKVKNPCKICLESVNNKTGLQCQGACSRWAHFSCLNYTPGKIQDIKTGILKVLCPCPGCKTAEPKEYLTKPPYTCPDHSCAAKQIPRCRSSNCPLNKPKPSPPREISQVPRCRSSNCPLNKQKPHLPRETSQVPQCGSSNCPLNKQKRVAPREISFESNNRDSTDNKSDPTSAESNQSIESYQESSPPPPSRTIPRHSKSSQEFKSRSPSSSRPQTPPRETKPQIPPRETKPQSSPQETKPQSSPRETKHQSSPRETKRSPPTSSSSPDDIAQRVCPKANDEKAFTKKKSLSCSCILKDSGHKIKTYTTSSDSHISAKSHKILYQALEDMCNTVGQLSLQLKELMCKMIETIQSTSSK